MTDDTFSYGKADFVERCAALAGKTAYRTEVGSASAANRDVPNEHMLASAFAMARKGEHDIGPEIALALVCGTTPHRVRIVRELAVALLVGLRWGKRKPKYAECLLAIADDSFLRVMTGKGSGKPEGIPEHQYGIAAALADRILWQCAEETYWRAAQKYYPDGKIRLDRAKPGNAIAETA